MSGGLNVGISSKEGIAGSTFGFSSNSDWSWENEFLVVSLKLSILDDLIRLSGESLLNSNGEVVPYGTLPALTVFLNGEALLL